MIERIRGAIQANLLAPTKSYRLSFLILLLLTVVVLALWIIGQLTVDPDPDTPQPDGDFSMSSTLMGSPRYRLWIAALALSILYWGVAFKWGWNNARKGRKLRQGGEIRVGKRHWMGAIAFSIMVGVLVFVLLRTLNPVTATIPLHWWRSGRYALAFVGVIAAIPWVAIIWSITDWTASRSEPAPRRMELEDLWGLVEKCLLALSGIIFVATMSLVILRYTVTAQISQLDPSFVDPAEFPEYAVILYGGMYALALAVAWLPLHLAWRKLPQ